MPPGVQNQMAGLPPQSNAPYQSGGVLTPNDSTPLSYFTRGIYVGGTGDVTVIMVEDAAAGSTTTFKAVPAGTTLPICASTVKATGTTATNLVALY